jgi:hypothetical protein
MAENNKGFSPWGKFFANLASEHYFFRSLNSHHTRNRPAGPVGNPPQSRRKQFAALQACQAQAL